MSISGDLRRPIVFTGSSIIALWENLPQFFPGVAVLNTAISGSQTHEIYARLDELVIAHSPGVACYYCGSNDINNVVTAETIVGNVVKTYDRLQLRLGKVEFVFLSIIKAPQKMDRWEAVDDVNTQLSGLAKKLPGLWYIDVNPVFFTEAGRPRMDLYQADQLHLTSPAYTAFGRYLAPRVLAVKRDSGVIHQ